MNNSFKHPSHNHPLFFNYAADGSASCYGCNNLINGCPSYGCKECTFYLHKPCFELPQEINHPYHPLHPLRLNTHVRPFTCDACFSNVSPGFSLSCKKCCFNIEIDCKLLLSKKKNNILEKPYIEAAYHPHLLHLFQFKEGSVESVCFRCVQCGDGFPIQDGPLPLIVKDKGCQNHQLNLISQHLEYDTIGYYCDVCEKERDPSLPAYFCKQCNFIAELKCIVSKLIPAIVGEVENVELITLEELKEREEIERKSKTKNQVKIEDLRLTEDEVSEFNYFYQEKIVEGVKENWDTTVYAGDVHTGGGWGVPLYSDRPLQIFLKHLNSVVRFNSKPNKYDEDDFVYIRDYIVPRTLAPILEKLLHKYGDFSADCTLSPKLKVHFFCELCETMKSMSKIRVKDVSQTKFIIWMSSLRVVQLSGFKIDFAFDHLKRIIRANFGVLAEKAADQTLARKEEEIKEVKEKLKVTKAKLEERINKLAVEIENDKKIIESEKSSLMEECLRDRFTVGWKIAGEDLLS